MTETPVAVVGVAHDHQLLLGQHVERLAPVAERGEGGLGDVRPGRPRAFHRTVQPPLAARHRLALLFRARPVAGEGRQVELDPCQRQQLPLAPAPVALHQQADARQVAGAHVDVRRADERAGGVSLPYRRTDAQRLEQRAPGVLGIVRAEHAVEGRRQHVAVAAGVAETPARRPGRRGLGDEAGHVVTPTGVEHRHHGGFQWRELVVLLPVQPGRPVQQVAQRHLGMTGERRVVARHRVVELEAPFALGDAEQRSEQALAHRPGKVRGLGTARAGVALIDQTTVADHHYRVGTDAFATNIVATAEGIALECLQRRPRGLLGTGPVGVGPVFGQGREGEYQGQRGEGAAGQRQSGHRRALSTVEGQP